MSLSWGLWIRQWRSRGCDHGRGGGEGQGSDVHLSLEQWPIRDSQLVEYGLVVLMQSAAK